MSSKVSLCPFWLCLQFYWVFLAARRKRRESGSLRVIEKNFICRTFIPDTWVNFHRQRLNQSGVSESRMYDHVFNRWNGGLFFLISLFVPRNRVDLFVWSAMRVCPNGSWQLGWEVFVCVFLFNLGTVVPLFSLSLSPFFPTPFFFAFVKSPSKTKETRIISLGGDSIVDSIEFTENGR